jgi:predicted nucleotidyltransferase
MEVDSQAFAAELGTTDRTLRRAVAQGLIRAERPSPRKLEISLRERHYLRRAWPLLSELRALLRTESSVSLAVLFGSQARGEADPGSDVDLLVKMRLPGARKSVERRISAGLGRSAQLVDLADAEATPLLLAEVLRDGRVLVDRDDSWSQLTGRAARIKAAARRERSRIDREFESTFG